MNKQIFIDGKHEYDLIQDGDVTYLYYSDNEQWSSNLVGQLALSVVYDDDFDFTFAPEIKNRMDCTMAEQVLILLKYTSEGRLYEIAEKQLL